MQLKNNYNFSFNTYTIVFILVNYDSKIKKL